MIDIENVRKALHELGINNFMDNGNGIQFFWETKKNNPIKYYLDTEGDFLELSAYSFEVSGSDWMLRIINKYNTEIYSPYKILKFRRQPNKKLCIELDIPKASVCGEDLIKKFIILSCEAIDEIDELLTTIEKKMPINEQLRCMQEAEKGLYVNVDCKYEMRW